MTARILVVDDIEANVRLLEDRLTAEYYEVVTAFDGPTALAMAASTVAVGCGCRQGCAEQRSWH